MLVTDLEHMNRLSAEYAQGLVPHTAGAYVVSFSGDLGSGKTTFIQGMLRAFGVTEHITSPTFVIQKAYSLTGGVFDRAIHIDAYRLHSPHELEVLGWAELVSDPRTLILIEWPEKVSEIIPGDTRRVTLKYIDDTTREIVL